MINFTSSLIGITAQASTRILFDLICVHPDQNDFFSSDAHLIERQGRYKNVHLQNEEFLTENDSGELGQFNQRADQMQLEFASELGAQRPAY